ATTAAWGAPSTPTWWNAPGSATGTTPRRGSSAHASELGRRRPRALGPAKQLLERELQDVLDPRLELARELIEIGVVVAGGVFHARPEHEQVIDVGDADLRGIARERPA